MVHAPLLHPDAYMIQSELMSIDSEVGVANYHFPDIKVK